MYICTAGIGERDPRAAARRRLDPPGRPHPAVRHDRRARHRDHARPRRVRARRRRSSRTRARSGRSSTRCSRRPGRRCAACATRPAAAWPPCSTSSRARRGWRCSCARPPCRSIRRWPGASRAAWDRPDVRGQRGQARRLRGRGGCGRGAGGAALRPRCERAAEIGEVRTEPPGMVLVETSFGGKRVMDQLVGDPLPRIC